MEVRLVGAHTLRAVRTVRLRPLSDGFMEAAAAVGVARAVSAVLTSACAIAPGCSFEAALPRAGGSACDAEEQPTSVHTMQVLECDPPCGGLIAIAGPASHLPAPTVATFTLGAAEQQAELVGSQSVAELDAPPGHRLGGRRPSTASLQRKHAPSRATSQDVNRGRQSHAPAPPSAPRLAPPSGQPASGRGTRGLRRPVVARHGFSAEPPAEPSTAGRQRTPPRGRPALSPAAEGVSSIAAAHPPLAAAVPSGGRRLAGQGGIEAPTSPSDAQPIRPGSSAIGRLRGLRHARVPPAHASEQSRAQARPPGEQAGPTLAPQAPRSAAHLSAGHPGLAQPSAALPLHAVGRAGDGTLSRPAIYRPEALAPAPPAALPAAASARPQSAVGRRLVDGMRAEFAVLTRPARAEAVASEAANRRSSRPSLEVAGHDTSGGSAGAGAGAGSDDGADEQRVWAGQGHRLGSGRGDARPASPVTVSPQRRKQDQRRQHEGGFRP